MASALNALHMPTWRILNICAFQYLWGNSVFGWFLGCAFPLPQSPFAPRLSEQLWKNLLSHWPYRFVHLYNIFCNLLSWTHARQLIYGEQQQQRCSLPQTRCCWDSNLNWSSYRISDSSWDGAALLSAEPSRRQSRYPKDNVYSVIFCFSFEWATTDAQQCHAEWQLDSGEIAVRPRFTRRCDKGKSCSGCEIYLMLL